MVRICYVDESGDLSVLPAPPPPDGNHQPVLVIGGLFVDSNQLDRLTHEFLNLKYRYFPGLPYSSHNYLDRILPEIKGSDLRRNIVRGTPAQRRQGIGSLTILSRCSNAVMFGLSRAWIKGLRQPFVGRPVYTSSIQGLCTYFDHYLDHVHDFGVCIADSRTQVLNVNVSHSVFTQKYRAAPSVYGRIVELPSFGHSENHAGIQLCDLVCSALLFPIACFAYCTGYVANLHVQAGASILRQRYGQALKGLQYRYQDLNGRYIGGLVVADALQRRNASAMFQ